MSLSLPSRYEDLDESYRGRLIPNPDLLSLVNQAQKAMLINGGIRFLPIYGESGAGKTSAVREISTHIPSTHTFVLSREEIESKENLIKRINKELTFHMGKLLVPIIDQYEENVLGKEIIPTQFVEYISLLDRGEYRKTPIIFMWLTTSVEFQQLLVSATSRNRRVLLHHNFKIIGPNIQEWPKIMEETFSFHNNEKSLADFDIIEEDLQSISRQCPTLGSTIEMVGTKLSANLEDIQNLSEYQVIMMWPVSDALRNQRVLQFTKPREGYKLNWEAWYRELNAEDRNQLPLRELNRTRLYFDVRLIPVRVADLHRICLNLEVENVRLGESYLERFRKTHFFQVVSDNWETYEYNPIRERESKRAEEARDWYSTVTTTPVLIGKRIAKIFSECGVHAVHEKEITSQFSTVRSDVYVSRPDAAKDKVIIELKAYSAENTMPSTIKDAIKVTLRRHAQLAGFLQRQ